MTSPDVPAPEVFLLRRHKPYVILWFQRGASAAANQIMAVALGWQVYTLTHDPLDLGLVGLVQFVPALLLALPAGQAVDRFRRRTMLGLAMAINATAAGVLAVASLTGQASLGLIFPAAALVGAARAFQMPASQAILPGLVPPAYFSRAIAANSSILQVATITGPALGGLLYAFGPGTAYAVCTAIFGVATLLTTFLPHGAPVPAQARTLRSVFAGLGFIWQRKAILGAISLDLFAVLFGGATALLPIYTQDILHQGPLGLGLLRAAPAVGALLVSSTLAGRPLRRHAGAVLFTGVIVFGLATCLFAVSRSMGLSLLALALIGAGDTVSVVVRLSLVQLGTPDEMRGRVSAVNGIFIGTSNQLGEFESGVVAAWLGPVGAALTGGLGTLLIVGFWAWLFPELRRIDRLDEAGLDHPRTAAVSPGNARL